MKTGWARLVLVVVMMAALSSSGALAGEKPGRFSQWVGYVKSKFSSNSDEGRRLGDRSGSVGFYQRVKGWTAGVGGLVGSTARRLVGSSRENRSQTTTTDDGGTSGKPNAGLISSLYQRVKGFLFKNQDGGQERQAWLVDVRNRDDFLYEIALVLEKQGESSPTLTGAHLTFLTYANATDLFILNDNSPLFHPDFFRPLAEMANLSLTRTWSSRAGGLLLGRKYALRWEAFMKPLLKFVDRLSDSGLLIQKNGMQPPELAAFLDGSCGSLPSELNEEQQEAMTEGEKAVNKREIDFVQKVKPLINGLTKDFEGTYAEADAGVPSLTWKQAMDLGTYQLQCATLKWKDGWLEEERVNVNRMASDSKRLNYMVVNKLEHLLQRSEDFRAVLEAKAGDPHRFLTRLSKDLPAGWQFSRGKKGLFGKGIRWLNSRRPIRLL